MQCLRCGSKYIVNLKYVLCDDCNFKRLHGGSTRFEIEMAKETAKQYTTIHQDRSLVKYKKKRVDHSISERTKAKRIITLKKDRETYLQVFLNKPNYCEECGAELPDQFLANDNFCDNEQKINCIGQYSHILSKAAYPEFRNDWRNFNRLCPNPCHDRWEFHDKENMKIFKNNQIIIEQLQNERNGKASY